MRQSNSSNLALLARCSYSCPPCFSSEWHTRSLEKSWRPSRILRSEQRFKPNRFPAADCSRTTSPLYRSSRDGFSSLQPRLRTKSRTPCAASPTLRMASMPNKSQSIFRTARLTSVSTRLMASVSDPSRSISFLQRANVRTVCPLPLADVSHIMLSSFPKLWSMVAVPVDFLHRCPFRRLGQWFSFAKIPNLSIESQQRQNNKSIRNITIICHASFTSSRRLELTYNMP